MANNEIEIFHRMSDYDRIRKWIRHIPDLNYNALRKVFLKALQKKSRVSAIRAKCEDCVGFQPGKIARCEVITCPLWQYRPTREKGDRENGIQKIAAKLEKELQQAVALVS